MAPTETKNNEWVAVVMEIISRGNSAEVRQERDKIVVVELKRQVKIKTTITG